MCSFSALVYSEREFDVVIFGASGFTGEYVVEEMGRMGQNSAGRDWKWAIAGRNEQKLNATRDKVAEILGKKRITSEHVSLPSRQHVSRWTRNSSGAATRLLF